MIAQLVEEKLPFSAKALAALKSIMTLKTSERGTLFGETGTGSDERKDYLLGWFVATQNPPVKDTPSRVWLRGKD